METYYSGIAKQIEKQKACVHHWAGPFDDKVGKYYKCFKCSCIQRDEQCKDRSVNEQLHDVCGAYVDSVQLDYDYFNGGGIVTLRFNKPRRPDPPSPCNNPPKYKEPLITEISFPFEKLTVRQRNG
jgi:hypothetical protein